MHNETDVSADIVQLRERQVHLDNVIVRAYGWHDLDLGHGFHDVPYLPESDRTRFTISEHARIEVLQRLLELNNIRHSSEVDAEPAVKRPQKPTSSRAAPRNELDQSELELDAPASAATSVSVESYRLADKIAAFLKSRRSWLSKSDILAYVDIPDGQWNAAINDLLARGKVERQGERRGARYRISESD